MFREDFKTNFSGNKLFIEYFQGVISVDVKSKKGCHEHLIVQARKLDELRKNILVEADKYINE